MLLSDALTQMDRITPQGYPIPFSITFITCNRKKNTGGEQITLTDVTLAKHQTFIPLEMREKDPNPTSNPTTHDGRSHEFLRRRRKLYNPKTDEILSVHPRLIIAFNGQKICWQKTT